MSSEPAKSYTVTAPYIITTDPRGKETRHKQGATVTLADLNTAQQHIQALVIEGALAPTPEASAQEGG